jgi:hypothetical protein
MGLFTALGDALAKYHPERVMEHLRLFWSRINIPKMIRSVEEAHLWPELINAALGQHLLSRLIFRVTDIFQR